ncbi:DGQHR domain-containing protein [Natronospirillum operosum]|uniref:DGQHR domain-containing protein n=1 Tax=Natronospirillum operosum TaxID=2759953 RepID=A0A4Z0WDA3_9GAMM|nr:DGQHR domain-containing protein [Natronospirillum operosum]TGG91792.1 DGQHR domain-containing protein [Natronospirillum operosum]
MSSSKKLKGITLPALRGVMGDWVYYTCLVGLDEIAKRVRFAEEIHSNRNLSEMIQRQLKKGRSDQIANYIKTQNDRFFNSLVVATYGGEPNWHALSDVRKKDGDGLTGLDEETISSIGFLTFRGDENLFALDGQHRLSGIKKLIKDGIDQDPYDEISVIFVAHKETRHGLERTRRLFTTLNKTARPVSKGDIIALDEDDVMAICVRRLIEQTPIFSGDRIAFVASNNMPTSNTKSLTTIGNLYDTLTIFFTSSKHKLKKSKAELQRTRPDDEGLDLYFEYAKTIFDQFRRNFTELDEFFRTEETHKVVSHYRGPHGGSALFRPIGLEIFSKIISTLTQSYTISEAVSLASRLPRNISGPPYNGLMWDDNTGTISNAHKVTLREILLYMLNTSKYSDPVLLERYRRETGSSTIELPNKVI